MTARSRSVSQHLEPAEVEDHGLRLDLRVGLELNAVVALLREVELLRFRIDRHEAVGAAAGEILSRLEQGDTIVLFAEGTSSDGNRVLPFMTSLFAAAKPSGGREREASGAVVQTLSLVYTRLHGIPLGRADRPFVGWYGVYDVPALNASRPGGNATGFTLDVNPTFVAGAATGNAKPLQSSTTATTISAPARRPS